jgi:hypothetical protein
LKRAAQITVLLLYVFAMLSTSSAPNTNSFEPTSVSLSSGNSDSSSSDTPLEAADDDDDQDDVVQTAAIRLYHTVEQAPLSVAPAEYPSSHVPEPQLRPPRSLRA